MLPSVSEKQQRLGSLPSWLDGGLNHKKRQKIRISWMNYSNSFLTYGIREWLGPFVVCLKPQIIRFVILVRHRVWLRLRPRWETHKSKWKGWVPTTTAEGNTFLKGPSVKIKYAAWCLSREAFFGEIIWKPGRVFCNCVLKNSYNTTERCHHHTATVFNWLLFFQSFCARGGDSHRERSKDLEVFLHTETLSVTLLLQQQSYYTHSNLVAYFAVKIRFLYT